MTDEHELEPMVLLHILGLLDHRRWSAKAAIVSVIGSEAGGNWFSAADVGLLTGLSPSRARAYLAQLESDRVIERPVGGTGSQQSWCRVNPDVMAWRGVPWRIEPDQLALRVMFHEEQSRAATTPGERFAARPRGARRKDFFARARAARRMLELRHSPRGPGARGERTDETFSRAALGRAGADHSPRGPGARGERTGSPNRGSTHTANGSGVAIGATAGADGATTAGGDTPELERIRASIVGRSLAGPKGSRFLNGAPLERVRTLVAMHGAGEVLAAVRDVPPNAHMVPAYVDALGAQLAGGDDDTTEPVDFHETGAQRVLLLSNRIDRLHQLIATHEDLGDEESAAGHRDELRSCETELAALTQKERARA